MEMKKLIDQVVHGEPDAFEFIVRNFERKIYTFCYFMLGNRMEAEEAAQEVFLKRTGSWRATDMTATTYFCHGCIRLRRIIAGLCSKEKEMVSSDAVI